MAEQRGDGDVVKRGGVARDDAETEDVTRDTYGFDSPRAEPARDRKQRIAEAEREAEQAGIPGVQLDDDEA